MTNLKSSKTGLGFYYGIELTQPQLELLRNVAKDGIWKIVGEPDEIASDLIRFDLLWYNKTYNLLVMTFEGNQYLDELGKQ